MTIAIRTTANAWNVITSRPYPRDVTAATKDVVHYIGKAIARFTAAWPPALTALVWTSSSVTDEIEYINARWSDIGWTLDDIGGAKWLAMTHPEDLPRDKFGLFRCPSTPRNRKAWAWACPSAARSWKLMADGFVIGVHTSRSIYRRISYIPAAIAPFIEQFNTKPSQGGFWED